MGQHNSLVQNIRMWLGATRPKTLLTGISPVIAGAGLATLFLPFFSPIGAIGALLMAIGFQVAANFANDADDGKSGADKADRKGPTRLVATGQVKLWQMRLAAFIVLALVGVVAAFVVPLGAKEVWIAGILAVIATLAYTGAGIAYGYKGLGELICFIFFGPVAVMGTHFLCTGGYTFESLIMGLGCGAMSVALLEVNNIRDYHSDKKAGKKTLAVRFGRNVGLHIYQGSILFAIVCTAILAAAYFWVWAAAIILMLMGARNHATLRRLREFDGTSHNIMLWRTSLMQFIWVACTIAGVWISYSKNL